jgi:O-antigen ligase
MAIPKASSDQRRTAQNLAGDPPAAHLRPWFVALLASLFTARLAFPSESAVQGDGLALALLWNVVAAFWLVASWTRRGVRVRFQAVDAAVVALVAWYAVSALWAAAHASPRPAVNMLWEWAALGTSFLLARQLLDGVKERRAMVAAMVAMAVVLAVFGLFQYFVEFPATQRLFEKDPLGQLREARMNYQPGSPEYRLFYDRLKSAEPTASFALTNSLAGYLAPWLVVSIGLILATLAQPAEPGLPWWKKRRTAVAGLAASLATVAMCLLLTKSRSAYLAVLCGLTLGGLMLPQTRRWLTKKTLILAAAILVALVGAGIASRGLDKEILTEAAKSLGYRLQYWQGSMEIVAEHPLVGCGPGNFQSAYQRYKLPTASEEVADPHNFLVEIWATAGTPALAALATVLGLFLARVVSALGGVLSNVALPDVALSKAAKPRGEPIAIQSARTTDDPLFVLGGGLFGVFLGFVVGAAGTAPPSPILVVIAVPVYLLVVAILFGWVQSGRLPQGLAALGIAVLLINLLAAGGLSMPGVAGTLWILMAIELNGSGEGRANERAGWRMPPRWLCGVFTAATIAAALACYATGYKPVSYARAELNQAREDFLKRPGKAQAALERAAEADPIAVEPWRELAAFAVGQWMVTGEAAALDRFEMAMAKTLEVEPLSGPLWWQSGEWYIQIAQKKSDRSYLEKAIRAYQQAVVLYPNYAKYHATLALALFSAGDRQAGDRERTTALWLDEVTPHEDKKLEPELRNSLLRNHSERN